MWFLFALTSAILAATQDSFSKRLLLTNISPLLLGGIVYTIAGTFLFLANKGQVPHLDEAFYAAVGIAVLLNIIGILIQYKAFRSGDISLASPMLAFTPVFLILTSFIILHQLPSPIGVVGILLVVVGSYILYGGAHGSVRQVFSNIRASRVAFLMLAVAFVYSISTNFNEIAAVHATPLFSSFATDLTLGICFLILFLVIPRTRNASIVHDSSTIWWLIGIGLAAGTADWASNTALTLQIVSYVIAVKRISILFAVLYGAFLFKEKSLKERLWGAFLMLLGIICIAL